MVKSAKEVIVEKVATIAKMERDKRFELLQKNGLVHSEYADKGAFRSNEFPFYDLTNSRFYRLVADAITEEEYIQLKNLDEKIALLKPKSAIEQNDHGSAALLIASAVFIYVAGFLFGVFAMVDMDLFTGLLVWIGAFVMGSFFLGMKEIIRLLLANRHR
jgi:lipopolysaccharide export LptBFGC system permease protein LptF